MSPRTERPESAFVRDALRGTRFAHVNWVAETGSTNDDLDRQAQAGAGERVLITDLQTAGKGRRGRVWDAPSRSSILMSVLVREPRHVDAFWSVGAIALAASQAIDELTSAPSTLKWPNDVLLGSDEGQKKVAGVLAQVSDDSVIVGIGINVNWPEKVPGQLEERGTAVNRHVSDVAEVARAPLAADILLRAIGHLESDRDALRAQWIRQCSTLGRTVRLELDKRGSGTGNEIIGNAVDIAADGALILERDGQRTIHQVGDVVHLRRFG